MNLFAYAHHHGPARDAGQLSPNLRVSRKAPPHRRDRCSSGSHPGWRCFTDGRQESYDRLPILPRDCLLDDGRLRLERRGAGSDDLHRQSYDLVDLPRSWSSYAPTYLIYADKQRTADEAKKLIDDLGMAAHLDEYKARAFVVGPSNGTAYGPADLTAFQDLLRTRRSSNLKIIGVGAGATFVNSVIAKYAFAVAGILTYGGTVDRGVTSSIPVPAYVHGSDRAVAQRTSRRMAPPPRSRTRQL